MGLLDFVKEHYRIGLSPNRLGQLSTLFITHIAGSRTNQTGHGIFFHVLGHIDTYHGIFIIKEVLGKGLGKLRLTYAGRS